MIIDSEFLIKIKNAKIDAKNAVIGSVKLIKFGKLKIANCSIIFKGTSLPVDFLNCSTKSPMKSIVAKIKNVIKKA